MNFIQYGFHWKVLVTWMDLVLLLIDLYLHNFEHVNWVITLHFDRYLFSGT